MCRILAAIGPTSVEVGPSVADLKGQLWASLVEVRGRLSQALGRTPWPGPASGPTLAQLCPSRAQTLARNRPRSLEIRPRHRPRLGLDSGPTLADLGRTRSDIRRNRTQRSAKFGRSKVAVWGPTLADPGQSCSRSAPTWLKLELTLPTRCPTLPQIG